MNPFVFFIGLQLMIPIAFPVPNANNEPRTYYGTLEEIQIVNNISYLRLNNKWYSVIESRVNFSVFKNKNVGITLNNGILVNIFEDHIGFNSFCNKHINIIFRCFLLVISCLLFKLFYDLAPKGGSL